MQRIIGPLIINLDGYELTAQDIELINNPLVGGVILFEDNYKDHQQVKDLIDSIKEINIDLIISVDHEGGRVQRFKKNFTHLPSFESISKIRDPMERERLAMCCGFVAGHELSEIGINMNYSPVIDISHPSSKLLKDRTFGSDIDSVVTLSRSYIKGIIKAGIMPVLKHYPGHGNVKTDTHTEICATEIDIQNLLNRDLIPFFCGMFQKEVAKRICQNPGTKAYGILSVLCQIYYHTEYLFSVSPGVFSPPPKVNSGVITLTRKTNLRKDFNENLLFKIVKLSFHQRRKTLRNSLKTLNIPKYVLEDSIFGMRPEKLSGEEFIALTKKVENAKV